MESTSRGLYIRNGKVRQKNTKDVCQRANGEIINNRKSKDRKGPIKSGCHQQWNALEARVEGDEIKELNDKNHVRSEVLTKLQKLLLTMGRLQFSSNEKKKSGSKMAVEENVSDISCW